MMETTTGQKLVSQEGNDDEELRAQVACHPPPPPPLNPPYPPVLVAPFHLSFGRKKLLGGESGVRWTVQSSLRACTSFDRECGETSAAFLSWATGVRFALGSTGLAARTFHRLARTNPPPLHIAPAPGMQTERDVEKGKPQGAGLKSNMRNASTVEERARPRSGIPGDLGERRAEWYGLFPQ